MSDLRSVFLPTKKLSRSKQIWTSAVAVGGSIYVIASNWCVVVLFLWRIFDQIWPMPAWPVANHANVTEISGQWYGKFEKDNSRTRVLTINPDNTFSENVGSGRLEPYFPEKGEFLFRYNTGGLCWSKVQKINRYEIILTHIVDNPDCLGGVFKKKASCLGCEREGN